MDRRPRIKGPLALILGCVAAFVAGSAAAQDKADPRRFAIVVGVNQYADQGFVPLAKAKADAEELERTLRRLGGFRAVTLMTDGLPYTDPFFPTKAKILERVANLLDILRPEDQVLFFFSGHGVADPEGAGYLLPVDAQVRDPLGSGISLQRDLVERFEAKGAVNAVFLIDACQKTVYKDKGVRVEGVTRAPPAAVAITAAGPGKASYEDPAGPNGLFTRFLILGLAGAADLDRNGQVGVAELERYLPDAVSEYAFSKGLAQVPAVYDGGKGTLQPPLVRLAAPVASLSAPPAPASDRAASAAPASVQAAAAQYVQFKLLPETLRVDLRLLDESGRELKAWNDVQSYSEKIPPGIYRVEAQDRGFLYYPWSGVLTVGSSKVVLPIELKPNFGSLRVNVTPSDGVEVYLNGQRQAPLQGGELYLERLKSGSYEVVLSKELYDTKKLSVRVEDGGAARVSEKLAPNFFVLELRESSGLAGTVWIDGAQRGSLPASIRLPYRDAELRVLPSDPRYREWTARVSPAEKGALLAKSLSFEGRSGRLEITTDPDADAELVLTTVGGGGAKRIGTAPLDYDTLVGDYELSAKALSGGRSLGATIRVTVREGQSQSLRLALKDLSPPAPPPAPAGSQTATPASAGSASRPAAAAGARPPAPQPPGWLTSIPYAAPPSVASAMYKPGSDLIRFATTTDRTIQVNELASGKAALASAPFPAKSYRDLSSDIASKLRADAVSSLRYSLQLNPYPDAAPYQARGADGRARFNPLAIREIRYALNWLVNRQTIIDGVLFGSGAAIATPIGPASDDGYAFRILEARLGLDPRGNEQKACAEIEAAMRAAAELPENKGRLAKSGQYWTFDGEQVALRFLIRLDDPSIRLPLGRYVADQLEKAGLKVERLEYDRSKCLALLQKDDPARLTWSVYTESWSGFDNPDPGTILAQMYAPMRNNMPGGLRSGVWSYADPSLDAMGYAALLGAPGEARLGPSLALAAAGLRESVRIFLAVASDYSLSNRNLLAVASIPSTSPAFFLRTAEPKADAKGAKILPVSVYSPRGALFMSALDPAGGDGFSDETATLLAALCGDRAWLPGAGSSRDAQLRLSWKADKMRVAVGNVDGKPAGNLPVPLDALIYDAEAKCWVSGRELRGATGEGAAFMPSPQTRAMIACDFSVAYGPWHSGSAMGIADLLYAAAFRWDWSTKTNPDDKAYDPSIDSTSFALARSLKGITPRKDGGYTLYFDAEQPYDGDESAAAAALDGSIGPSAPPIPWELAEALSILVLQGGRSGSKYSFSADGASEEVDLLEPKCVGDIAATLRSMMEMKYIPRQLTNWVAPDQAIERYKAAIAFIERNGHALISNGPYRVSKCDLRNGAMELSAFEGYPRAPKASPERLVPARARVDSILLPQVVQRTKDFVAEVSVSMADSPLGKATPAPSSTKVELRILKAAGEELVYQARMTKPGTFQAAVPAKDIGVMKPGAYVVWVQARLEGPPSVLGSRLVLF